jgi:hypothetical protein
MAKAGDMNTSYFHKCASGKRRKTTIVSFESDEVIIEGQEKLLIYATKYYKKLFGPEVEHDIRLDPNN